MTGGILLGMKSESYSHIIGVDEVGRGPIAGPVTVCAFMVPRKYERKVHEALYGITDSKKLSEKKRKEYFEKVVALTQQGVCDYAVSHVAASIIDRKGITYAIQAALKRSLRKVSLSSGCFVYLDGGLHAPIEYAQETVIKGDQKIWHISAASVIAKVLRDKKMTRYANRYRGYGFEKHKGYGTKKHRDSIKKKGLTPIHRSTWISME